MELFPNFLLFCSSLVVHGFIHKIFRVYKHKIYHFVENRLSLRKFDFQNRVTTLIRMREQERKIITLIISSIITLTIIFVYFFFYPLYQQYFPRCIFHNLTRLYCPLCGTQRAVAALLDGNISAALRDNLLFVLALPFLIYSLTVLFINSFCKKQFLHKIFFSAAFIKAVILFVIAFAVLRNVPSYPFNLLAPL